MADVHMPVSNSASGIRVNLLSKLFPTAYTSVYGLLGLRPSTSQSHITGPEGF